jgi:ribosome-binding factor A
MTTPVRAQRIAERIREEMAEILVTGELKDPRLVGIFVTDVTVDRELAFADVYVSALEGRERATDVLAGLRVASGYVRHLLASRVALRSFPSLRFHWDETPERAERLEHVLDGIREEGLAGEGAEGSEEAA